MNHRLSTDILELISLGNWTRLKAFFFLHKTSIMRRSRLSSGNCDSAQNPLHYACQFHPPLDIIKCFYKSCPKFFFQQDCDGRYPLHIACKYGCSPDVIKFILKKNPDAAKELDTKDRTPFLLAAKSYVRKSDKECMVANRDLFEVIAALDDVDPTSSIKEDFKGISALEYAIDKDLAVAVVELIQAITERCQERIEKESSDFQNICIQLCSNGVRHNDHMSQKSIYFGDLAICT